MDEEIESDGLFPTKTAKVIEETSLKTVKQVALDQNWKKRANEDCCCTLFVIMGSKYERGKYRH